MPHLKNENEDENDNDNETGGGSRLFAFPLSVCCRDRNISFSNSRICLIHASDPSVSSLEKSCARYSFDKKPCASSAGMDLKLTSSLKEETRAGEVSKCLRFR